MNQIMFLTAILDFAEKIMFANVDFSRFLYFVLETFLIVNPKKKLLLQCVVGPYMCIDWTMWAPCL